MHWGEVQNVAHKCGFVNAVCIAESNHERLVYVARTFVCAIRAGQTEVRSTLGCSDLSEDASISRLA